MPERSSDISNRDPAKRLPRSGFAGHWPISEDPTKRYWRADRAFGGLAGDAELTAQKAHLLAFHQTSHKPKRSAITELSFHSIASFPLQFHGATVTHLSGTTCPPF